MHLLKKFSLLLLLFFIVNANAADYRIDSLRYESGNCSTDLVFAMIGEFSGTTVDESFPIGDDDDDFIDFDYVWINVYDANCNLIMTFRHQIEVGTSETEFLGIADLEAINIPTARPFSFYIYDVEDTNPNGPGDPLLQTYVDDMTGFTCESLPLQTAPNCIATAPIPALSTWAIMILSILVLIIGAVYLRGNLVLGRTTE